MALHRKLKVRKGHDVAKNQINEVCKKHHFIEQKVIISPLQGSGFRIWFQFWIAVPGSIFVFDLAQLIRTNPINFIQ